MEALGTLISNIYIQHKAIEVTSLFQHLANQTQKGLKQMKRQKEWKGPMIGIVGCSMQSFVVSLHVRCIPFRIRIHVDEYFSFQLI